MKFFKQAKKWALGAVTVVTGLCFSVANAAITALELAPIQTDIETTITNVTPVVVAIMAVVIGIGVGVGLVKSLIKKGAS